MQQPQQVMTTTYTYIDQFNRLSKCTVLLVTLRRPADRVHLAHSALEGLRYPLYRG